eukprot:272459_1
MCFFDRTSTTMVIPAFYILLTSVAFLSIILPWSDTTLASATVSGHLQKIRLVSTVLFSRIDCSQLSFMDCDEGFYFNNKVCDKVVLLGNSDNCHEAMNSSFIVAGISIASAILSLIGLIISIGRSTCCILTTRMRYTVLGILWCSFVLALSSILVYALGTVKFLSDAVFPIIGSDRPELQIGWWLAIATMILGVFLFWWEALKFVEDHRANASVEDHYTEIREYE